MNTPVVLAGFLSGAGVVMCGLALIKVGIALVNALGNGVSLVRGTAVPLIVQHREALRGRLGMCLFLGMSLALACVATKSPAIDARCSARHLLRWGCRRRTRSH